MQNGREEKKNPNKQHTIAPLMSISLARTMWQAIKTDIHDFLTTASSEGEMVLNQLDRTMDDWDGKLPSGDGVMGVNDDGNKVGVDNNAVGERYDVSLLNDANDFILRDDSDEEEDCYEESPEEEAERLCRLQETFAEPLSVEADVLNDLHENPDQLSYNDDDEEDASEEETMEQQQQRFEEQQIQQFLKSFDIDSHSQEISQLLHPLLPLTFPAAHSDGTEHKSHVPPPETVDKDAPMTNESTSPNLTPLQQHYQTLVLSPPHPKSITHQQFWTRYYYRCDPTLISERRQFYHRLQQQQQQQQHNERILQEVSHAALQFGKSAASLLQSGWAGAMGVASNVEKVMEESLKYHPARGRPPFVMMAGEDDDEEYFQEEGWGSDSDADDEDVEEEDSIHDEVEFVGGQTAVMSAPVSPLKLESLDVVKLRRTLMQAESERNTIMEMVEKRNEEIARLNCFLEQRGRDLEFQEGGDTMDGLQKEVKHLKNVVSLRSAYATICELKVKIDALKSPCSDSLESLDSLIQEELNKQVAIQTRLDEYTDKIQEIHKQKQMAEERLSQLMLQCHGHVKNDE